MTPILPTCYREHVGHTMPKLFLSDATYAAALQAFVIVCTDAVVIDRGKNTFWLARRAILPMKGLWIIGGRRFGGETPEESMARCFKRETGLDLSPSRFEFQVTNEYRWSSRQQVPQDAGSHNLAHTFAVELTPEERDTASASLEKQEYVQGHGLQELHRERLVAEEVHPAILDLYDLVFPSFA